VIFFHVVVNLGMVVGLLPVTGVPLPFLSYGGSSFLMFSVMIGLLLGVATRRGEY
jgi:rod shape determining protein RodA